MRILIVAPNSDLQNLAELIAAAGESQPTILHQTVTNRELLNTLRGGQYQIVHFAGHGERMELELNDGPLSVDMLSSAIQEGTQPMLMFFNSCASLPAAAHMHSYGVGYVIGWRQEDLSDDPAGSFAVTFYNTLRLNGFDVHRAFATATEGMHRHYPGYEEPVLINGRMAVLLKEMDALRALLKDRNTRTEYTGHIIGAVALVVALVSIFLR